MTDENNKEKVYKFIELSSCNMCGCSLKEAKFIGHRLNRSQGLNPRGKKGIAITVWRCKSCGLVYSNPMPVPESLQDHYSGITGSEYTLSDIWSEGIFKRQLITANRLLKSSNQIKALDIGSGHGHCLKSLVQAGYDAYGIEGSEVFYKETIKIHPELSDRITCIELENAFYEDNTFDFITFGAVLEHLYDPRESLEKALNWLKPGGIIHLEVPNANWLISILVDKFYQLSGTTFTTRVSPMHSPFHIYEFTLKSLIECGEQIGFKIKEFKYFDDYVPYFPVLLQKIIKKLMKKTSSCLQLEVWLEKI